MSASPLRRSSQPPATCAPLLVPEEIRSDDYGARSRRRKESEFDVLAHGEASTGGLTRVGAESDSSSARGEPRMALAGSQHSKSGRGEPRRAVAYTRKSYHH
ncbi:hypothetical protein SORBI_3005G116250 [Sorghum bicolor]|uniref:Uncharacterized protein n=1 Tax=Sorghum bicolor TaxID=4558 RepID=A0A1Z5RIS0_SORBI|nr:hypothetical protein SORBI_3005G116250 [Sorghum bicolor]